MSELRRAARQARRQIWLNRWLAALGGSVAVAAGLFIAAVVVQRTWIVAEDTGRFFGLLALVLCGLALVASVVRAVWTRYSLTSAAARLDLAAGLKERISSGLYCEAARDPVARAVVVDATRASRRISVRQHLPVRLPSSARHAGGSLVLALLVFWLLPTVDLAGKQERRRKEEEQKRLVERTRAAVEPVLTERVRQIRRKHPGLEKQLAKLEPMKDARLEKPSDVRAEPIKRINQVGQELRGRRSSIELGKVEEFKKLTRRLVAERKLDSPVGQLARALKGNLKAALDALDALKQELAKAPKTDQDKKQAEELRQQVRQLSEKLEQVARDDRKSRDALGEAGLSPEQIRQALEHLDKDKLNAVEKMLADKRIPASRAGKLMQQLKVSKAASRAAERLARCLKEAGQGDKGSGQMSASAMAALSEAGKQLSQLEAQEQELNQIDSAMADLESMKQQLTRGCSACSGSGMKDGQTCSACRGTGMAQAPEQLGPGIGRRGRGGRGAAKEATGFATAEEHVKVPTLPGKIITMEFENGELDSGKASAEFKNAAIAAQREVADAIARDELPRIYHGPLRKYFDHSVARVLEKEDKEAGEQAGSSGSDTGGD